MKKYLLAGTLITAWGAIAHAGICGPPVGKRFYFGGERLAAFGHMSGLLVRTGSAGPDEVRRPSARPLLRFKGELWTRPCLHVCGTGAR
jgi:hypothetical protein